jgi:hypothetical protein
MSEHTILPPTTRSLMHSRYSDSGGSANVADGFVVRAPLRLDVLASELEPIVIPRLAEPLIEASRFRNGLDGIMGGPHQV